MQRVKERSACASRRAAARLPLRVTRFAQSWRRVPINRVERRTLPREPVQRRGTVAQRTYNVPSRCSTSARRKGSMRVKSMFAAPRPGILARAPCGRAPCGRSRCRSGIRAEGTPGSFPDRWSPSRGRRPGADSGGSRRSTSPRRCRPPSRPASTSRPGPRSEARPASTSFVVVPSSSVFRLRGDSSR
jgi:hypothetical protein